MQEKQPHKKDRIFFLKIDNHKNKSRTFLKIESDFVPGRPGTEEFVPGFLHMSLSRDKGTEGQENVLVPGQLDNGTSRPGLSRDVPRDAHWANFNKKVHKPPYWTPG